jgi:serine protease Do
VQGVTAGGPAGKGGLVSGDVITAVNGHQTPTVDDFTSTVSELKPGTKVSIAITTQQGAHKTLHLTLGTFPGSG